MLIITLNNLYDYIQSTEEVMVCEIFTFHNRFAKGFTNIVL